MFLWTFIRCPGTQLPMKANVAICIKQQFAVSLLEKKKQQQLIHAFTSGKTGFIIGFFVKMRQASEDVHNIRLFLYFPTHSPIQITYRFSHQLDLPSTSDPPRLLQGQHFSVCCQPLSFHCFLTLLPHCNSHLHPPGKGNRQVISSNTD